MSLLDELRNKITHADCLEVMKQLPDKCIDLILTDPPYGISCDGGSYGLGVKPKQTSKKNWDGSIPKKVYFDEMFRVSKNQIIFGGNYFTKYLPTTKAWIVWDKIGGLKLKNNFSECELIWTSLKAVTKKITFIQQGFINDDKNENKFRFHPTQKPLRLVELILQPHAEELRGGGAKTGLYKINGKIRKLTPVECERCQNLPDNYTAGISDTQRYKCIGNGWTVNVIAHIFSFLKEGFDEN